MIVERLRSEIEGLRADNKALLEALRDCQAQTLADRKGEAMREALAVFGAANRWRDAMPQSWLAAEEILGQAGQKERG